MKYTLLKYTGQWFSMNSESCTTITNTNSRTFSSPRKRSSRLTSCHSPFSAPLSLWQLLICSVPIDLPILNISHKWNHTPRILSCPTSFTLVLTFIHDVARKCIYSFLRLHNDSSDTPCFVHLFLSRWTCGFQFLCWGYKWSGYEYWCTSFSVDGCFSILLG